MTTAEDRCNRTVDIYRTITEPRVTMETRGKAMHCSYRVRIQPPRDDWVVFLRFTRLRVGEVSPDRKECIGGFIQIIDGYKDSNISKRTNPGRVVFSWKSFSKHTPRDPHPNTSIRAPLRTVYTLYSSIPTRVDRLYIFQAFANRTSLLAGLFLITTAKLKAETATEHL